MNTLLSAAISYIFALISSLWCFISYLKDPDQAWYPIFALIFGFAVTYVMTDLAMRVIDRPAAEKEDENGDEEQPV